MKFLPILLLVITSAQASFASAAIQPTETVYSGKGYPYKLLIDRAESINIIYSEDSLGNIQCSVKAVVAGQELLTSEKVADKAKFKQKPLASCLSRQKAKELLAKTFD